MSTVIEVRGLRKVYGDFVAVGGLDCTVEQGDIYGFLGPNGAGKSTSIRMMMSLITPTAGTIKLFGQPLETHREAILRRVGAIVERPDFYNYLSAQRNLELLGRLSGADVSTRSINRVLGIVGLAERATSKVKTYSHGMKQRLGIAQALLHNPDLIVLDEPTTGLDPHGMKDMRDLILALAADHKKTVFLSSHILPEVELTANRMIIINRGKAIVEGTVQDLLNAGKLRVTIGVSNAATAASVLGTAQLPHDIQIADNALIMMLERSEIAPVVQHLVQHGIAVDSVVPVRSLEEYFLTITKEAA
ncbi:MAG: ABC transporter ATP-binding protein [Candidatus Kapabacteria bacterium]|jgi:ABC-type multidrug transport system ATPase subunit|nr:ABC transporter ATP-binding protein [Candidatus Kapabacteria bacterium]